LLLYTQGVLTGPRAPLASRRAAAGGVDADAGALHAGLDPLSGAGLGLLGAGGDGDDDADAQDVLAALGKLQAQQHGGPPPMIPTTARAISIELIPTPRGAGAPVVPNGPAVQGTPGPAPVWPDLNQKRFPSGDQVAVGSERRRSVTFDNTPNLLDAKMLAALHSQTGAVQTSPRHQVSADMAVVVPDMPQVGWRHDPLSLLLLFHENWL
jgi:hypothetical protein